MKLFTIEFNGHKYVGHGETKRTRTGYEEHVYVIEDGYDQIADGRVKWQNRSWQNFEYAKALEDAVIKWFGKQASNKIYKAVDDSRDCQEAMDKFIAMFNRNESLKESKELDRKLFMSLVKLGDNSWDGYSILNDGNFVKRIYADNDREAIRKFRDFLDRKNESCKRRVNEGKRGFVRKYKGCSIHDAGDTFVCTNKHGLNIGQSRTESGCEAIIDKYLEKNESCNTRKNRKLTEKRWRYELKRGKELRDAIEDGDYDGILATLQMCYQELADKGFIDQDDCNRYVSELDHIDTEDDGWEATGWDYDDDFEDDEEYYGVEDEIDDALDNFYDLCDNIDVWVTL